MFRLARCVASFGLGGIRLSRSRTRISDHRPLAQLSFDNSPWLEARGFFPVTHSRRSSMSRDSTLSLRSVAQLPQATQLSLRSLPFAQLLGSHIPDTFEDSATNTSLIALRLVFPEIPTCRIFQLLRAQVANILPLSIETIVSATLGVFQYGFALLIKFLREVRLTPYLLLAAEG